MQGVAPDGGTDAAVGELTGAVTLEDRIQQLEAQVKALLPGGVKPSEVAEPAPEPVEVAEPTTEDPAAVPVDAPPEVTPPATA